MENVIWKALFSQQDFIIKIKWKDSLVILQQNVLLLFYAIIYAGLNVISSHLSFKRYRLPHFIFEPISVSLTLFRLFWFFLGTIILQILTLLVTRTKKEHRLKWILTISFTEQIYLRSFFFAVVLLLFIYNFFLYLFLNFLLSF